MNPDTERVSAVLMTAFLVLALVGGAISMVGTVSADAQNLTVTNEAQTVRSGGNLSFEVSDDLSPTNEEAIQVWIDENGTGVYNTTDPNVSLASNAGMTIEGMFENVDLGAGQYKLRATEMANDSFAAGVSGQSNATFTVDNTPPSITNAVAFTETNGTQAYGDTGDTVIEIQFTEPLTDGTDHPTPEKGDFNVTLTDGTVMNPTVNDGGTGDNQGDRRVVLDLGSDVAAPDVFTVAITSEADFTDTAGNPVVQESGAPVTASTTVAQNGSNTTAFRGEQVAIVADEDNENVAVENLDDGTPLNKTTGLASKVAVWNSAGQPTDQEYAVLFDGRTEPDYSAGDVALGLEQLGLTTSAKSNRLTTEENLVATVSTDVDGRSVRVELHKEGSIVATRQMSVDGTETVDFGAQSQGVYAIRAVDRKTRISATSDTIQVVAHTPTPTVTTPPPQTPTPTATSTPIKTPTPIQTPTPTATEVQTPTATVGGQFGTPPGTETPDGEGIPGFGVGAVLAALLAAALLAARRSG